MRVVLILFPLIFLVALVLFIVKFILLTVFKMLKFCATAYWWTF